MFFFPNSGNLPVWFSELSGWCLFGFVWNALFILYFEEQKLFRRLLKERKQDLQGWQQDLRFPSL